MLYDPYMWVRYNDLLMILYVYNGLHIFDQNTVYIVSCILCQGAWIKKHWYEERGSCIVDQETLVRGAWIRIVPQIKFFYNVFSILQFRFDVSRSSMLWNTKWVGSRTNKWLHAPRCYEIQNGLAHGPTSEPQNGSAYGPTNGLAYGPTNGLVRAHSGWERGSRFLDQMVASIPRYLDTSICGEVPIWLHCTPVHVSFWLQV